jgi:ABC-type phosphate transport system substrate-binding protein
MKHSQPLQQRAAGRLRPPSSHCLLAALTLSVVVLLGSWQTTAAANEPPAFRVIVHASNPARSISSGLLADLFLKKSTRWGNGEAARPLDQRPNSAVRRAFSQNVLKRTVTAVRSYWQQRIFSGRDVPPPEVDSDESVVNYVSSNPGAVGYVSPGAKLGSTKELTRE